MKSIVLSLAVLFATTTQVFAKEQIQLPQVKTSVQQNIVEFKNVPECDSFSKEQEVASSYKKIDYIKSLTSEQNLTSGDIKTSFETDSVWDGAKNQVSVCQDKARGTIRVKLLTERQQVLQIETMDLGK